MYDVRDTLRSDVRRVHMMSAAVTNDVRHAHTSGMHMDDVRDAFRSYVGHVHMVSATDTNNVRHTTHDIRDVAEGVYDITETRA